MLDESGYFECDTGAAFIRRWQSARRSGRTGRLLASKVGVSPSTVACALNEESARYSPWPLDRIETLLELMALSDDLERFLWLLLRRDHADLEHHRVELTRRIEAARNYRLGRRLGKGEASLLSRWYHLAIFELAHLRGLPADPETLGGLLIPRVPAEAIRRSIELTTAAGLVEQVGETLAAVEGHVLSLPEDADEAAEERARLTRLHGWYLRRAVEALECFPTEERFFHADLLMIPASAREELEQRIADFHGEMLLLAEERRRAADAGDAHELRYLGIQLYPLSGEVRGAEPPP